MTVPFITEPGIYGMTDVEYHADPVLGGSLSSTGARTLATRTPAHFHYERRHGRPDKGEFDFGRAAHARVLGKGGDIVVILGSGKDKNAWVTKETKAAVARARAAGKTPIRLRDNQIINEMADALRAHTLAGPLFGPDRGRAEQVVVWFDEIFEVWRRAMLDWHTWLPDGRLCIVDYKSTRNASPASFGKAVADYGYHQQDPWYCDGAIATGLAGDLPPAFLFVCQEKDPPYAVSVNELTEADREWGRLDNRRALQLYRDCSRAGQWPAYGDDVNPVCMPVWAIRQREAAYDRGAYDLIDAKDIPA
jgi:hypothetical protein